LWRYFELKGMIYECAPGILAGLLIFMVGKVLIQMTGSEKVQATTGVTE